MQFRPFLLTLLFASPVVALAYDVTTNPPRALDRGTVRDYRPEGKTPYQLGIIELQQGVASLRFIAPNVTRDFYNGRCAAAERIVPLYQQLLQKLAKADPFVDFPPESDLEISQEELAAQVRTAGIDCQALRAVSKTLADDDVKIRAAESKLGAAYEIVHTHGVPIERELSTRPYGSCDTSEIHNANHYKDHTPKPAPCPIHGNMMPAYNCVAILGVDKLVAGYDQIREALRKKREYLRGAEEKIQAATKDKDGKSRCPSQ